MSDNITATRSAATGRPLNILLWCVQALLALEFVGVSSAKLMGMPEMVALFTAVGFGQWFRYVTGLLELTGAVLIVVPRTRSIGAACEASKTSDSIRPGPAFAVIIAIGVTSRAVPPANQR
jgi:putative oxidoreductase